MDFFKKLFTQDKRTPDEKLMDVFQKFAGSQIPVERCTGAYIHGHCRSGGYMVVADSKLVRDMRKAAAKADRGLILKIDGVMSMLSDRSLTHVDKWIVGNVRKDVAGEWRVESNFNLTK